MPKFACSYCSQHIDADESLCGQQLTCPNCGESLQVPTIGNDSQPAAIHHDKHRGEGFGRIPYIFLWIVLSAVWLVIVSNSGPYTAGETITFLSVTLGTVGITACRLTDIGHTWWWAWLAVVPIVSLPVVLYCFIAPRDFALEKTFSPAMATVFGLTCLGFLILAVVLFLLGGVSFR